MATATKKRGRPPKLEQQFIPGTEPPSVPRIDQAAKNYHEVMTERCELSKQEDDAKQNLIAIMKEHGLVRYETKNGLVVIVTDKTNVKCKSKTSTEADD